MTIRKSGDEHELVSRKGRVLGKGSKAEMEKREKQVTFFKNLKKSSGGPGSLKSKVKKKSLLKR